jgi:hypothetical protein
MNRKFLLVVMLPLAACSRQGTEPAAPAASPAAEVSAAHPAPATRHAAPGKLAAPLPEGLKLDFANYVRDDRLVSTKSGTQRRRVKFEYLQGDQKSVFESLGASLAAVGFKPGARKDPGNGNIRMNFSKPKFGRVTVVVTPSIVKPRNPQAVGSVTLDLPAPASMQ